jgi:hypothetical protein
MPGGTGAQECGNSNHIFVVIGHDTIFDILRNGIVKTS